jgi:hypothetical protein
MAAPVKSAGSCPRLISRDTKNPFGSDGASATTLADYKLMGCWRGTLQRQSFVLDEYFSPDKWAGGIAVRYGRNIVAHFGTKGISAIVRFTGEYACLEEGVYPIAAEYIYADVNIRTGRLNEDGANSVCPRPDADHPGPQPAYVLGLKRKYPTESHVWEPSAFEGTAEEDGPTPLNYLSVDRWSGMLNGKKFAIDVHATAEEPTTVRYDGLVVTSSPIMGPIIRFTGKYVCFEGHLGMGHVAVMIPTGAFVDDAQAQDMCSDFRAAFTNTPSPYVQGLKQKFAIVVNNAGPIERSTDTSTQTEPDLLQSCDSRQLTTSTPAGPDGGAGNSAYIFQVTNTSSKTCVLSGVPTLDLFDERGGRVRTIMICANCANYLFSAKRSETIRLQPGGSAHFLLGLRIADGSDAHCQKLSRVEVLLENRAESLTFHFGDWRVCGRVDVSAWRSGPYDDAEARP